MGMPRIHRDGLFDDSSGRFELLLVERLLGFIVKPLPCRKVGEVGFVLALERRAVREVGGRCDQHNFGPALGAMRTICSRLKRKCSKTCDCSRSSRA